MKNPPSRFVLSTLLFAFLVGLNAITAQAQGVPMGPCREWRDGGWVTVTCAGASSGSGSGSGSSSSSESGSGTSSSNGSSDNSRAERRAEKEQKERQRAKANAFHKAGVLAWNRGQWGIAAEQFRQAYANNPDSKTFKKDFVDALYQQGVVAFEKGDWEHAANMFQSAYLHKPDKEFQRLMVMARGKALEARQRMREQYQNKLRSDRAYTQYELGRLASESGNFVIAEHYFNAASHIYPAEPGYRKSVAWAKTKQGDVAWAMRDFAGAITLWKAALETDPENAYARRRVQEYVEEKEQDKAVATKVQRDVRQLAEDLKSAKPAGDLDFGDIRTEGGAFGVPIAKPNLIPNPPGKTGTNVRAGDQLKSAGARAARDGELRENFDGGRATGAGSLPSHTVSAGPPSFDVSTFSERARKDPQLMTLVQDLAGLQELRRQLESERAQLETARNLAKDALKMKELDDLAAQKAKDYQNNLKAIIDKTEQAERRHLEVDTEVQATPPPEPARRKP